VSLLSRISNYHFPTG